MGIVVIGCKKDAEEEEEEGGDATDDITDDVPQSGTEVSIYAGNEDGIAGDAVNVDSALDGKLNRPHGIALDNAGNLYVADYENKKIKFIKKSGTKAGLYSFITLSEKPSAMVLDKTGNRLIYVAKGNTIKTIAIAGKSVATLAGTGDNSFTNGAAASSAFNEISGLLLDEPNKKLYISDTKNYLIRVLDLETNMVSTFIGKTDGSRAFSTGKFHDRPDGTEAPKVYHSESPADMRLNGPRGMALIHATAPNFNFYFTDTASHIIRMYSSETDKVTIFLGQGKMAGYKDSAPTLFNSPKSLVVDSNNNMFVSDTLNYKIRKITIAGTKAVVSTIAGSAIGLKDTEGDAHDPLTARFLYPDFLAINGEGDIFVSDTINNVIRKITFH
ncbi:MAG: hypothetical protein JJV97_06245 [SAR324 cluster bacterium]|nr:hypothetical protein [SAR324 cluster bacterium]